MKLYQLEYFISVCKTGSISKASDELLISRPAVSRALRELEQEYGLELFARTSSGIILTEAGKIFYEQCLKIQEQFTELNEKMNSIRTKNTQYVSRHLRIGTSYTAGYMMFPLLRAFERAYPDINLEIVEISHLDFESMLKDSTFDLSISLCFNPTDTACDFLTVSNVEFVFCCSRSHPLALRDHVTIYDIKDEPLVALSSLLQQDNQISLLYRKYELLPNIAYVTAQVSMMKRMVKEGLYCTIKPSPTVSDDPDIVMIPFDPPCRFPMRIQWCKAARQNTAFFDFIAFVKDFLSVK